MMLVLLVGIEVDAQDVYGEWTPVENSEYVLNISKYGTFKCHNGSYGSDSYLFSMKDGVVRLTSDSGYERHKMRVVVTGEGDERILEIYDNTQFAGKYRLKSQQEGGGNQGANSPANSGRYDGAPGSGGSGWSLTGRGSISMPKPSSSNRREGKIIVKIYVDRQGNVIQAEAPVKGSTITDSSIVEEAKACALKCQFTPSDSAPESQTGTVTYVYTMQ